MVSNIQTEIPALTKASHTLKKSKQLLFSVGVGGQFLFVVYIVAFYGGVVLSGRYEKINEQLPHGIIEGDLIGNFMLAMHLALAAVITFAGPLQFFPAIRNRFPTFHRWSGRIYFITAFLISGAGLYMNATRGAHGGIINSLGNTLNASLIMTFSVLAWRTAMRKDFVAHRKWAIRAFVMVSGVWFFRIGYGLWILLSGFTMIGANSDLTGPFDRFLSYGHSLIPLLIVETYFFAKASKSMIVKKNVSKLFYVLSLFLAAGIIMVGLLFWLPAL